MDIYSISLIKLISFDYDELYQYKFTINNKGIRNSQQDKTLVFPFLPRMLKQSVRVTGSVYISTKMSLIMGK